MVEELSTINKINIYCFFDVVIYLFLFLPQMLEGILRPLAFSTFVNIFSMLKRTNSHKIYILFVIIYRFAIVECLFQLLPYGHYQYDKFWQWRRKSWINLQTGARSTYVNSPPGY